MLQKYIKKGHLNMPFNNNNNIYNITVLYITYFFTFYN